VPDVSRCRRPAQAAGRRTAVGGHRDQDGSAFLTVAAPRRCSPTPPKPTDRLRAVNTPAWHTGAATGVAQINRATNRSLPACRWCLASSP
jgi:hypothetical protein